MWPDGPRFSAQLWVIACLSLGLSERSFGEDAISADRPDFVNSPDVVGSGRFQIEAGYASQQGPSTTTPILLRYGAGSSWELRLASDGLTHAGKINGVSDTSLGVKWHLQDADHGQPATGLLFNGEFATGSAALRSDGFIPALEVAVEWDLPHELSIGLMPGIVLDRDNTRSHFVTGEFAVSAEKSWNTAFSSFLEVAAQRLASRAHGGSTVTLDTGGSYLLNQNLQLDAAYFLGLDRHAPNAAWTAGLSYRL